MVFQDVLKHKGMVLCVVHDLVHHKYNTFWCYKQDKNRG